MPKSNTSLHLPLRPDDDEEADQLGDTNRTYVSHSPTLSRRLRSARASDLDLHSRMPARSPFLPDERSSLLSAADGVLRNYASVPASATATPRPRLSRTHSGANSIRMPRHHHRAGSFGQRLLTALRTNSHSDFLDGHMEDSKASGFFHDERVWYDQFTSTDWVHDSIADAFRVKALRSRRDFRGRLWAWFDSSQGWILVAIIGCITAILAYFVDVTESAIFDIKSGYCEDGWFYSKRNCCLEQEHCPAWVTWAEQFDSSGLDGKWVDFIAYVGLVVILATLSSCLTLLSKTEIPSAVQLSTLDENLAADHRKASTNVDEDGLKANGIQNTQRHEAPSAKTTIYYSAAGSGVAEVKVILSGFVLHGYLGAKTLVVKTLALVLSVASGLSLGKEGPYVHIATCVGNVACRLFSKYHHNDGKRREVLSASAASGVAVAFGAPIGGVLFSLEEVSYYFPPKTLFRTFFCCIAAALSLKFLNPYGTNKIVIFEVRYLTDWQFFEMIAFVLLGVLGGALGAVFIKASRIWARTFRRIPMIKKWPVMEVALVAFITGCVSFWNRYTKLPVTELLFELASPCDQQERVGTGLCPHPEQIPGVIGYLLIAFIIKALLTTITFGIKVPAGIYVPSMVVGGMLGRIVGHFVQYLVFLYPDASMFAGCPASTGASGAEACVTPGVYAMVAAGATMCGVTRLSVTLAVILFELTGSLDHVLPFSLAVLVSKWTADALEPLSIYDLLTDMNSYPFLDNKIRPVFTTELGDITPRSRRSERVIDISNSPLVLASDLRRKLEYLHQAGEIDGGLPILRHNVLVGLIPAPDLEFALDKLDHEETALCLMASQGGSLGGIGAGGLSDESDESGAGEDVEVDPTDFTPYIDPAPVALEIKSPMDLVYECFVKLGLRYICVLRDGHYAGLVHKKTFVRYVKELEEEER
ncbi:MAG: hypothetical protein M1817_001264 [Caeruleum heppii]|nr:MAG: hypothetical protein M1817_001264 [Caeruleum heppii]